MKRKPKRSGMSPGAAVAMLIVCSIVAFVSLRSQFGGGNATAPADPASATVADDPGVDPAPADEEAPGVDLLLHHGSWGGKVPVRMAFASIAEAAIPAAPSGETSDAAQHWIGADPPRLHLGVLMVGDAVRRAVLDGRVVGVGDTVGKALVVAIDRDRVLLAWAGRRLTYDLDNDYPREFRAELRRRGIDPSAAAKATAVKDSKEEEQ